MSLTGCSGDSGKDINASLNEGSSLSDALDSTDTNTNTNTDIDLDALNKSIENIKDLKFDTDVNKALRVTRLQPIRNRRTRLPKALRLNLSEIKKCTVLRMFTGTGTT